MNNDLLPTHAAQNRNGHEANLTTSISDRARRNDSASPSPSDIRRRRNKRSKTRRDPGLRKKLSFVSHLLKSLDLLVFAELSAMYYMECSIFRFLLRSVGQYLYLSPKDEAFPFLLPTTRVHVLVILIPNMICMLLHLFASLPTGPDYHRGYQHGGLIIDFIGQRPPTWRTYYILADVVILALQCLMMTLHSERERLRVILKTFRPLLPDLVEELSTGRSLADLDAEERGVNRNIVDNDANETENIEMRRFSHAGDTADGDATVDNGESGSRELSGEEGPRTHLSDIMHSGNAVLGEYHILYSLRSAATNVERTAAQSLRSISYGATLTALQARRRGTTLGSVGR